ncbi:bifunctional tRNA (5-methylaminomethyl-2-thiouridine)(34)-methyltransferase MnmD/FAD-dependent 5-carboxymethylaminomethyl-2-thiouridine(34) oxidoreductase MnmC [Thiomicrorhabdus sp. Milos-T2]|uniref:bifunctional tRNA (5-methylaminomethyl-2-thiouridine)(34)-methyltransferase MnmD/FAD-dependent 5-carboxymethylaminomethyl-2-thiouridine(34) oxidoreductase MnmC n=1 Tax=Thiomicrorhabdus sp. Milos-T2 TaxID=90814 RepID=UPI000494C8B8|nr:bifunctional tRNA (5-methylaminomethyl-2-thiouridine)(34)-methyltransferase MnmD/FAD-dependent 5-carboxymethylaminomethyl-2-thiouridine(34) oxidoreductase MnmC [Thiomicrorhabdus sp. Milos-T2]
MALNKLTLAQVSWTDEAVPKSEQFGDFYFSTDGGMAEVEHTFIEPNHLPKRFMDLADKSTFRIAETGFGSGLNFLMATKLWLASAPKSAQLHFISFEKYPLHLDDLIKAHQALPGLVEVSQVLQENYPFILPGWHDVWMFDKRVRLTLWFGDVLKGLPECDGTDVSKVDAWFLDGFAPAKNPDMWQPALFQQMARLSHLNTTFATFTAAGEVRRGIEKAGFELIKSSGFGKKREICSGQLKQQRAHSLKAPWFSRPQPQEKAGKAIVIGAGLAGGAVVNQLAQTGWSVTVLEAQNEIASQASGNLAGAVHPLITADWNLRSQWYLQGFEATLRAVLPWFSESSNNSENTLGDLTGLVQLAVTQTSDKRVSEAIERVGLPQDFAQLISQQQATDLIGTQASVAGVLFPRGGWLYPKALVERCLQHNNVSLMTNQNVTDISFVDKQWQVITLTQGFEADIVVVATGSLDNKLNTKLGLPIRPVKGQVSHIAPEQQSTFLKKAVTHEGYSTTCGQNQAVTGATFEAPDMTEEMSLSSHQANLEITNKALPEWLNADAKALTKVLKGRIAFRPTTPDHLPIVGAVADSDWIEKAYLSQSHTHAVYRYEKQRYQPGLYVSNGHGPRGLMSVFLAAESLIADIMGTALPQNLSLYHASHPARFAIRRWRSGEQALKKT